MLARIVTDWSLVESLQSFQPSEETTFDIYVLEKMTVAYAPQARPSHIFPLPTIPQFTNENPEFSFWEFLPCAVIDPPIPPVSSFAIEFILQSCHIYMSIPNVSITLLYSVICVTILCDIVHVWGSIFFYFYREFKHKILIYSEIKFIYL